MLKRLAKVMPENKFRNVSQGIFTSKLIYCIQLFGNVWGVPSLDENQRRFSAFTKGDMMTKLRKEGDGVFPQRHTNTIVIQELTLSRGGFCYRGAC